MSTAKFLRCHAVTKQWEGGWSDHPDDPGGKTMYGITAGVYCAWLKKQGKPLLPVRRISQAEAEQVYFEQYWLACGGPKLADGVDLATYDAAVNSGVARGRQWLLASCGGRDHETVKRICAKRLGFMQSLAIWRTFGRGWARRVADIEAKGVAWALAASGGLAIKSHLHTEARTAKSSARRQASGAAASAGGGAIATGEAGRIGDWLAAGIAALAFAALAVLIIRAAINAQRAAAYRKEAAHA
jgi:lysozyme family protein